MIYRCGLASGAHLVAARIMAGLSQVELASLAGIHRNSVQRWESMPVIKGGFALEKIEVALKSKGVLVRRKPVPTIMLDPDNKVEPLQDMIFGVAKQIKQCQEQIDLCLPKVFHYPTRGY